VARNRVAEGLKRLERGCFERHHLFLPRLEALDLRQGI
jgi:hypothetical protein